MPDTRLYSQALDPYFLSALGLLAQNQQALGPIRWASGTPTPVGPPPTTAAPLPTPTVPPESLSSGQPAPLIPGQVAPPGTYVYLPNPDLGAIPAETWNSYTKDEQELIKQYGWPLPAGDTTVTDRDLQIAQDQEVAKLRAMQQEIMKRDDPRNSARGLIGDISGQPLRNLILLQNNINPEDVYGYDPQAAATQQAFENSMSQGALSARWAELAQALAAAATNAQLQVWDKETSWGLPNAGDLYALQKPGGFIEQALARSGFAYSPNPAREVPSPDLWANWARAQQEIR